jgi:pyruvate kinase
MRRLRRTKIVATLGPASGNPEMIARLFEAGADVFRINMSHTTHDRMRELVGAIRQVEKDHNRPIGILVDLQGPKLRLGSFAEGAVQLKNGQNFVLDSGFDVAEGVQILHLGLGSELFGALQAYRDIGVTAKLAFFHIAIGNIDELHDLL